MGMIIEIDRREGHVQAMGHSVPLELGGEPELKRRCYEGLSRLNLPPDEVVFVRRWELEPEIDVDTTVVDPPASPAPPRPSQLLPPSPPQPVTAPATPAAIKAAAPVPPPRSHKRKTV